MLRGGRLLSSWESSRPNVAPNACSNGFSFVLVSWASPNFVAAMYDKKEEAMAVLSCPVGLFS